MAYQMIHLIVGNGVQYQCPKQAIISLGRKDKANHQQIDFDFSAFGEQGISRLHAFMYCVEDEVYIEDFGSRNGTYINAYALIPMRRYPITVGDNLTLGRLDCIFEVS